MKGANGAPPSRSVPTPARTTEPRSEAILAASSASRVLAGGVDLEQVSQHIDRGAVVARVDGLARKADRGIDEALLQRTAPRLQRLGVGVVGTEVAEVEREGSGASGAIGRTDPVLE